MKVDQCQPHENSWTACQSSQVVNWVKTRPRLAGNQIPFGGTNLVLYWSSGLALVHFHKYWLLTERLGGKEAHFS